MKGLILVLLFISSFTDLNGQIDKTYFGKSKDEFLKFSEGNRISFSIIDVGDFGEFYNSGEGIYKFKNGVLKIKVLSHDKSFESTYKILKDSSIKTGTIFTGHIVDEQGYALKGVILTYKVGNKTDGLMSDNNGFFYKEINDPRIKILYASYLGYTKCKIVPNNSKSTEYLIMMKKFVYNFLDHHIIVAEISLNDESNRFTIKRLKIKSDWL
jgi:hypothetical protein